MKLMVGSMWFVFDGEPPTIRVVTGDAANPNYRTKVSVGVAVGEYFDMYGESPEAVAAGLEALAAQVRAATVRQAA